MIVARFIWILLATYLPRALIPKLRERDPYPPLGVPIVMSWAGMRGVVSLAAALALPDGFPGRDFILATTFAVILVTVLIQGATLAPLIRILGLHGFSQQRPKTMSEARARAQMAAAQLTEVERHSADCSGTLRHPRLVEQYSFRARAAPRFSDAAGSTGNLIDIEIKKYLCSRAIVVGRLAERGQQALDRRGFARGVTHGRQHPARLYF